MGTLFERGLDPGKRSQLGAHYTDPDKIMLIINPVIVEPLTREWEEIRPKVESSRTAKGAKRLAPSAKDRGASSASAARENARAAHSSPSSIERLQHFRVLDPACGSGNFLYLALKDAQGHRAASVNVGAAKQMGLPRGFARCRPRVLKGIEINQFAAELARVSVWIGEIQWMREHGFDASRNPILKPLETIECQDALLTEDGSEGEWPEADVIIGNPPFLGGKLLHLGLRRRLRRAHVPCLRWSRPA